MDQGVSEIHTLLDKLAASYQFRGPASDWILPLHSSIASSEQKKVFLRPPDDIRKVNTRYFNIGFGIWVYDIDFIRRIDPYVILFGYFPIVIKCIKDKI